jgi:hypothetical protein
MLTSVVDYAEHGRSIYLWASALCWGSYRTALDVLAIASTVRGWRWEITSREYASPLPLLVCRLDAVSPGGRPQHVVVVRGTDTTEQLAIQLLDPRSKAVADELPLTKPLWADAATQVYEDLIWSLSNWSGDWLLTGHSYGGAVVDIIAQLMRFPRRDQEKRVYVVTYGEPPCWLGYAPDVWPGVYWWADGDLVPDLDPAQFRSILYPPTLLLVRRFHGLFPRYLDDNGPRSRPVHSVADSVLPGQALSSAVVAALHVATAHAITRYVSALGRRLPQWVADDVELHRLADYIRAVDGAYGGFDIVGDSNMPNPNVADLLVANPQAQAAQMVAPDVEGVWRVTFLFEYAGFGWSETVYSLLDSYNQTLQAALVLAGLRAKLLAKDAELTYIRISDIRLYRDFGIVTGVGSNPLANDDWAADYPTNALLVQVGCGVGASGQRRGRIFLRGLPDAVVDSRFDGFWHPGALAGYPQAYADWRAALAGGNWALMLKNLTAENPEIPVVQLSQLPNPPTGVPSVQMVVDGTLGGGWVPPLWASVRGWRGNLLSADPTVPNRGPYRVISVGADGHSLTLEGATAVRPFPVGLLVRRYEYALFQIVNVSRERITERKTGRPFGLPRGRQRRRTT